MGFDNRVAVVTGAGQGIGETYARMLAAEGAAVVVAEINEQQGQRVADGINAEGGKALFVKTDVASTDSCQALADAAANHFGGVDYLVNNAAIFAGMKYESPMNVDLAYYHRFLEVNMNSVLYVTRAIAPLMEARGGGAIVNQSSTAANMDAGGAGFYYALTKLGVNALTGSLAMELGPRNIRVNAVAPGPTATDALGVVPREVIDQIVAGLPLQRLGTTEDIANMVLFLLSDQASWITGKIYAVDGGQVRRAL